MTYTIPRDFLLVSEATRAIRRGEVPLSLALELSIDLPRVWPMTDWFDRAELLRSVGDPAYRATAADLLEAQRIRTYERDLVIHVDGARNGLAVLQTDEKISPTTRDRIAALFVAEEAKVYSDHAFAMDQVRRMREHPDAPETESLFTPQFLADAIRLDTLDTAHPTLAPAFERLAPPGVDAIVLAAERVRASR